MSSDVPDVEILDEDLRGRFHRLRADSMYRQELERLGSERFLVLLLDVWELHLEREGDLTAHMIEADSEMVSRGD